MRRRTQNFFDDLDFKISFNTRLREEANIAGSAFTLICVFVSIHASVRRRTIFQAFEYSSFLVSIHASVRRRTSVFESQPKNLSGFNTRLREEANFYTLLCMLLNPLFQYTPP